MLKFTQDSKVDFEQYEENINAEEAKVYVDIDKFMDLVTHFEALSLTSYNNLSDIIGMMSAGNVKHPTPKQLLKLLVEYCGIPQHWLINSKTREMSAAEGVREFVCRKLEEQQEKGELSYSWSQALRVIQEYDEYRTLQYIANQGNKGEKMSNSKEKGWADMDLTEMGFHYEQRATGRYYTIDDNLQGWNKEVTSSLTTPMDYYLWWGDFDQIDLRVFLYSMLLQADPKFREFLVLYEDKYEAFTRYMFQTLGTKFNKEQFTKNRQKYKAGVLSSLYGITQESLTKKLDGDRELAKMFVDFFSINEAYRVFKQNISDAIRVGCGLTLTDYFGVKRTIETRGTVPHPRTINQALNEPNQCCSNSIVILWVNEVMKQFRDLGYDKSMIDCYLIRHDEIVIKFHKSVFKDLWILKDAMQIQVDDWDMLTMECGVGIYYGEENEQLRKKFDLVCKMHEKDMHHYEKTKGRVYTPIDKTIKAILFSRHTAYEYCKEIIRTPEAMMITNEKDALKFIEEQSRISSDGFRRTACSNFIAYYGQISYMHPVTGEWMHRRPINEVLTLPSYALLIFNCTGNHNDYVKDKCIRYIFQEPEEILNCLRTGKVYEFARAEEESDLEHKRKGKLTFSDHEKKELMSSLQVNYDEIEEDSSDDSELDDNTRARMEMLPDWAQELNGQLNE